MSQPLIHNLAEPLQMRPMLWDEAPALKEEDEVEMDDGFYDIDLKTKNKENCISSPSTKSESRAKRNRTNSESFYLKTRLQSMKRNVSTPGFDKVSRIENMVDGRDENGRRMSSYLFEVEVKIFRFFNFLPICTNP